MALAGIGLTGAWIARGEKRRLEAGKGAYLLIMRLAAPLPLASGRFRGETLPAGWHVYCGSANGPGGIRARAGRHFKRRKKRRWHIDWLSCAADDLFAICFPGGDECALAARLMETGAFAIPLPGFGSSDCKTCQSHLLRWIG